MNTEEIGWLANQLGPGNNIALRLAWSERPCQTCRAIGAITNVPFGCYRYANQLAAQRAKNAHDPRIDSRPLLTDAARAAMEGQHG